MPYWTDASSYSELSEARRFIGDQATAGAPDGRLIANDPIVARDAGLRRARIIDSHQCEQVSAILRKIARDQRPPPTARNPACERGVAVSREALVDAVASHHDIAALPEAGHVLGAVSIGVPPPVAPRLRWLRRHRRDAMLEKPPVIAAFDRPREGPGQWDTAGWATRDDPAVCRGFRELVDRG